MAALDRNLLSPIIFGVLIAVGLIGAGVAIGGADRNVLCAIQGARQARVAIHHHHLPRNAGIQNDRHRVCGLCQPVILQAEVNQFPDGLISISQLPRYPATGTSPGAWARALN